MAVGDFNCPKCGVLMEHGHLRITATRGFGSSFKPEYLPWQVPLEKVGEQKKPTYEILFSGFNHESDARRCPKCRLILFRY